MKNNNLHPSRFTDAARLGLRVFPVRTVGKEPAVQSWKAYNERPASPDELLAWDDSSLNVGVPCGAASGVVVLDVDSPEAQALVDS